MKDERKNISKAEWKVMDVIWDYGQLKASDIIEKLDDKVSWNSKTIRTLIRRLVDKEILGVKKEDVNVYYSLVDKEEYTRDETKNFIKKVYDGSISLLLSNFVKHENLTEEDIDTLKNIIKDKEKEND